MSSRLYRAKPEVAITLGRDFLAGGPVPDISAYEEPTDANVDLELLAQLFGKAAAKGSHNTMDIWLAPRLHYSLRISRRLASDPAVWRWLAVKIGSPYVVARWSREVPHMASDQDSITPVSYFTSGDLMDNALSRLWWGAEMLRNGEDYAPVRLMFERVRTATFAMELRYSWYRPAPIAFVNAVRRFNEAGRAALNDKQTQLLSRTFNAYLSLRALEAFGMEEVEDESHDAVWRRQAPSLAEVIEGDDASILGPNDGHAAQPAIEELESWLREIAREIILGEPLELDPVDTSGTATLAAPSPS